MKKLSLLLVLILIMSTMLMGCGKDTEKQEEAVVEVVAEEPVAVVEEEAVEEEAIEEEPAVEEVETSYAVSLLKDAEGNFVKQSGSLSGEEQLLAYDEIVSRLTVVNNEDASKLADTSLFPLYTVEITKEDGNSTLFMMYVEEEMVKLVAYGNSNYRIEETDGVALNQLLGELFVEEELEVEEASDATANPDGL